MPKVSFSWLAIPCNVPRILCGCGSDSRKGGWLNLWAVRGCSQIKQTAGHLQTGTLAAQSIGTKWKPEAEGFLISQIIEPACWRAAPALKFKELRRKAVQCWGCSWGAKMHQLSRVFVFWCLEHKEEAGSLIRYTRLDYLLVLRGTEHLHPFLPRFSCRAWLRAALGVLFLSENGKWKFGVQPLKIWANSCLLYRLSPHYFRGASAPHAGNKPACLPWVTVGFLPYTFSLLSASHIGNSPKVARVFRMTLNSLIIVLNDQTAVETHHRNCVCLLHWLFLVNVFLAFVSRWQMC